MTVRTAVRIGCCVLWLWSAARPSIAGLAPDQQGDLANRLSSLADAVDRGDANETRQSARALLRWSRQIDGSMPVHLFCERAIQLSDDGFDPQTPEARQLHTALQQLAADLRGAGGPVTPAGVNLAEAHNILAGILTAPEYRNVEERPALGLRLLLQALDWLSRILHAVSRFPGADKLGTMMFYVVLGLLLLPLLGVIGYLLWQLTRQRRSGPDLESGETVAQLDAPEVHLVHADEFLHRGEFLSALKQFHLAALSSLERGGLVTCDRTRTNWEYLAQLESNPATTEPRILLRTLNRMYDVAVFGAQRCDEGYLSEFSSLSDKLMRTVAGVTSASPPRS
jgi:hypothetical protein